MRKPLTTQEYEKCYKALKKIGFIFYMNGDKIEIFRKKEYEREQRFIDEVIADHIENCHKDKLNKD